MLAVVFVVAAKECKVVNDELVKVVDGGGSGGSDNEFNYND